MLSQFINIRILPRWIIVLIDLGLTLFAVAFAYLLRFNFDLVEVYNANIYQGIAVFVGFCFLASMITGAYSGIIRYTGLEDSFRVTYTVGLGSILVAILNAIVVAQTGRYLIPYSIIVIAFMTAVFLLLFYRLLVKSIFSYYRNVGRKQANLVIFGAGDSGQMAQQVLSQEGKVRVVGFLEDDRTKIGKVLNGTRIYNGHQDLSEVLEMLEVTEMVISVQDLELTRKQNLVNKAIAAGVKVRTVPPVRNWIHGELSAKQIKEVKIEDLLGREAITIENYYVQNELEGKRILITGAAGSIGSEIVRQVVTFKPDEVILFDQSETGMFNMQAELARLDFNCSVQYVIGDVINKKRLERVFDEFRPHIIFHAAAYKHVPLMESNPSEAILCNVLGTKHLAELSEVHKVEKFVYISTDKAVNPTNVMGASKRIAEMFIQSFNEVRINSKNTYTKFITTRFGNVLGSNGSVIPLFTEQIKKGGPVTVTHPEITRFFMTIPEACQLVLEAAAMGKGGEIFIFDMGKSVKIIDLAEKMIQLSGFKPYDDMDIVFTGLREGEKLYEELLTDLENTIPTYNGKILIAQVAENPFFHVSTEVDLLIKLANTNKELELVQTMKNLVPEFLSNSSKFEVLDKSAG